MSVKSWMAVGLLGFLTACGGVGVVESGTYKGSITKVEADKKEIYVQLDNGPKVELYFKEFTKLSQGDAAADFSALAEGQSVEIEVKKVGKRLDPLTVKILP